MFSCCSSSLWICSEACCYKLSFQTCSLTFRSSVPLETLGICMIGTACPTQVQPCCHMVHHRLSFATLIDGLRATWAAQHVPIRKPLSHSLSCLLLVDVFFNLGNLVPISFKTTPSVYHSMVWACIVTKIPGMRRRPFHVDQCNLL
jgi:hypothetical protein